MQLINLMRQRGRVLVSTVVMHAYMVATYIITIYHYTCLQFVHVASFHAHCAGPNYPNMMYSRTGVVPFLLLLSSALDELLSVSEVDLPDGAPSVTLTILNFCTMLRASMVGVAVEGIATGSCWG